MLNEEGQKAADKARKMLMNVAQAVDDWDHESAHGSEDSLRLFVLTAIAAGAPNAVELAKIALETSELEFHRWCA